MCSLYQVLLGAPRGEPPLSTRGNAGSGSGNRTGSKGAQARGTQARGWRPVTSPLRGWVPPSPPRRRGSQRPAPEPQSCPAAAELGLKVSAPWGRTGGDRRSGGPGGEPRTTAGGHRGPRGPALHSHCRRERAGRLAARSGREGSASWPELPVAQRREDREDGRVGRSRLPFSVLSEEQHRNRPGAPGNATPSPLTGAPTGARRPSPLPTAPRSQGEGSGRGPF